MTNDVRYTYFVQRFIYNHYTFNIMFVYLFTAHSVVLRHLKVIVRFRLKIVLTGFSRLLESHGKSSIFSTKFPGPGKS